MVNIEEVALDGFRTRCSVVGAFGLLMYDYCLTLMEEARYIWPMKASLGKFLFLSVRYLGIISLAAAMIVSTTGGHTNEFCTKFIITLLALLILLLWLVNGIAIARIYAVYNRDKRMLAFLLTVIIVCPIISLSIYYSNFPPVISISVAVPGKMPGCGLAMVPHVFPFGIISSVSQEIIFLMLLISKWYHYFKSGELSPLFQRMFGASALYFVGSSVPLLINFAIWTGARSSLAIVGVGWNFAMSCSLGTRLLLSLHRQDREIVHSSSRSAFRSHRADPRFKFVSQAMAMSSEPAILKEDTEIPLQYI